MKTAMNLKDLKSPKGIFILGNLLQFKKEDKEEIIKEWIEECGELFAIKLFNKRILVATNTEFCDTILKVLPKKFKRFSKIDEVFEEVGLSFIFNSESESWKKQEKLISEIFTPRKVRGFYPSIHDKATDLITKITSYSTTEKPIKIIEDFNTYNKEVVKTIVFGNDSQIDEKAIQKHVALIFPLIDNRINKPLNELNFSSKTPDGKLASSVKAIEGVIASFISNTKANLFEKPELKSAPTNFTQTLLIESEKENIAFDEKTLYGNFITLLLAGEDTIANTLAWTLFHLAQHPEMVLKIRKEAIKVYPKVSVPKRYEQLANLKYTNAVVKEAIRLKSTKPMLVFKSKEDVDLNTILVPKDTKVVVQSNFGSMDEVNFSSPTEFNPDRWIKAESPYKNHFPEASKAIAGISEIYTDTLLSIVEITPVIASICKQFDFDLVGNAEELKESFAFNISPENLKFTFKTVKA